MSANALTDGRAAFRAKQLKRRAVAEVAAKHFAFFNASTPMHDRMMAEAEAEIWAFRAWREELREDGSPALCYRDWLDVQASPVVGCDGAGRPGATPPPRGGQPRLF